MTTPMPKGQESAVSTVSWSGSMILLMLAFSLLMVPLGHAATRLGLHVTQEELNVWRQRATNGPYRVAGDVSTNSPAITPASRRTRIRS